MNRSNRQKVRSKTMRIVAFVFIFTLCDCISVSAAVEKPVDFRHGPLKVSENKRYLVHEDETPFFYCTLLLKVSLDITEYHQNKSYLYLRWWD